MNTQTAPSVRAGVGEPGSIPTPNAEAANLFMFSVDLEDVRTLIPYGDKYGDRVRTNTARVLDFLASHDQHCTFFATGDIARRYPDLLAEVVRAGHEIGCHTSEHLPLDRHTPESFRDDLERCLDDFARAGAETCVGFRAPIGSLIDETRWAYQVLLELGFEYSSSVLAAPNPLYGWGDFGPDVPQRVDGLWEIPTSLTHIPYFDIPFAGGVYFRVLPFALVRWLCARRRKSGYPTFSYMHPYDIDPDQERFMHPEIGDSALYNFLLYLNRKGTLPRIDRLLSNGFRMMRYDRYVAEHLEPAGAAVTETRV